MGWLLLEERVACSACGAALVVEYARDADMRSRNLSVECPACHETFGVTLLHAASVFFVRRDGDKSVMSNQPR
jgi:ribosomal protein S27E